MRARSRTGAGGPLPAVPALIALALTAFAAAGCASGSPAVSASPVGQPAALTHVVDPCTLLTDAEVRTLLGELREGEPTTDASRTRCSLTGPSRTRSIRVAVFGDAQSAPSVFSEQLRAASEPQKVMGVGRAAFAVHRPDEVGVVVMTRRVVLAVSVVAAQGSIGDPAGTLSRLTPVVRQASDRI